MLTEIYPLPAKEYLMISGSKEWNCVELKNLSGGSLVREESRFHSSILKLSGTKPGLYMLYITYDDKLEIKKVILE